MILRARTVLPGARITNISARTMIIRTLEHFPKPGWCANFVCDGKCSWRKLPIQSGLSNYGSCNFLRGKKLSQKLKFWESLSYNENLLSYNENKRSYNDYKRSYNDYLPSYNENVRSYNGDFPRQGGHKRPYRRYMGGAKTP
jgi:hypothetical protein